MRIRLGPAGIPVTYTGDSSKVCTYIRSIGLDAYEYQATYGVRIGKKKAMELRKDSMENDVLVSIHAPYYINLSSTKREVIRRSIERLIQTARVGEWMGAYRIVFHPGFYSGQSKDKALKICKESISQLLEKIETLNIRDFCFAPETTGKKSQLGSLPEIINLCQSFDNFEPAIDFAHLHARDGGAFKNIKDYDKVVRAIDQNLEVDHLHCHYTRIEYTEKGERKHHILDEKGYGPPIRPLLHSLINQGWDYTIICETPLRDLDALKIKEIAGTLI